MYHSVTEDATRNWGPWRYAVTPAEFEAQISAIVETYNVVTMDDVAAHLGESEFMLPQDAAVVTFDDGYRDTLTQALPVLERHSVPATIYVTTELLGDPYGPFEFRLAEALRNRSHPLSSSDLSIEFQDSLPNKTEFLYQSLRTKLNRSTDMLEKIERGSPSGTAMLDNKQLQVISEHELIKIGAHGHHHAPLTTLSKSDVNKSISACISILKNIIGHSPSHFSYPYGSYNSDVITAVEELGLITAVTTHPNVCPSAELKRDYLQIPRIDAAIYPISRKNFLDPLG
jgi:peptidoglycan/xylan/chitin deacetylase (PgdA/CDA1 family)